MYDTELSETEISEEEISEEEAVQAVYEFAAEEMAAGASNQEVRTSLMRNGLDPESASIVVSNLARMRSEAYRESARKDMIHGALWCIGGTTVTLVSYGLSGGGWFLIAWGAIIFGGIQFFRGLIRWCRN